MLLRCPSWWCWRRRCRAPLSGSRPGLGISPRRRCRSPRVRIFRQVGLLLALPALEMTGLLEVAQETFGAMRKGFYGLRVTLLMAVFMALLRQPRAEAATRMPPEDLGRLLGLDRAPEVKTLR